MDDLGLPEETTRYPDDDDLFNGPDPNEETKSVDSSTSGSSFGSSSFLSPSSNNTPVNNQSHVKHHTKKSQMPASAKMVGKKIEFEQVYEDFKSKDRKKLRAKEPPFVARLEDDELDEIRQYIINKNTAKQETQNDPYYLFVMLVSGATERSPDFYVANISGKGRVGGPGRAIFSPAGRQRPTTIVESPVGPPTTTPTRRTTQRTPFSSVAEANNQNNGTESAEEEESEEEGFLAREFGRDPRRAERPITSTINPTQPTQIRVDGPPARTQTGGQGFTDEGLLQLLGNQEWRPHIESYLSRQRQYENLPWLERPETLGIMDLAPSLYYGMEQAFEEVLMNNVSFDTNGTTIDDLIQDKTMRILFAGVTAGVIGISNTQHAIAPSLDKREARLLARKASCLKQMSKYVMNPNTKQFYRTGNRPTAYRPVSTLEALSYYK